MGTIGTILNPTAGHSAHISRILNIFPNSPICFKCLHILMKIWFALIINSSPGPIFSLVGIYLRKKSAMGNYVLHYHDSEIQKIYWLEYIFIIRFISSFLSNQIQFSIGVRLFVYSVLVRKFMSAYQQFRSEYKQPSHFKYIHTCASVFSLSIWWRKVFLKFWLSLFSKVHNFKCLFQLEVWMPYLKFKSI